MSVTIEQDLKEYLDRFEQKLDKLSEDVKTRFDKVDERLNKLEVGQARLEGEIKALDEKLSGEIKTVDEKINGLSKGLDNQEFISRGVLISLIVAILGGLAKLFGLVGNP